jgi:Ser/Thr protein kinase RdoA (MazF antagonist)
VNSTVSNVGQLLARGRTAEIYAWGDGQVLKLFVPGTADEAIEQEEQSGRIVYAARLSVPAVGGRISVDGRPGLLYQRIDGPILTSLLTRQPWQLMKYGQLMAQLHVDIHDQTATALPSQHERLHRQIEAAPRLSPRARDFALRSLDVLRASSAGDSICHGDFHPYNIVMAAHQVVIDWNDATHGNPLADVARTVYLLREAMLPVGVPAGTRIVLGSLRNMLCEIYLREYIRVRGASRAQIEAWSVPIRAARMSEGIGEEEERLVRLLETAANR